MGANRNFARYRVQTPEGAEKSIVFFGDLERFGAFLDEKYGAGKEYIQGPDGGTVCDAALHIVLYVSGRDSGFDADSVRSAAAQGDVFWRRQLRSMERESFFRG